MRLRIYDWRFRDRRLEALYVADPEPAGVALSEDLSPEARRARELEALGYFLAPYLFGRRWKFCYLAANVEEVDPDSVRALRLVMEQEEPGWVEAVGREWEPQWDAERVSLKTGVPLQAVVAILENLQERGVLAEGRQKALSLGFRPRAWPTSCALRTRVATWSAWCWHQAGNSGRSSIDGPLRGGAVAGDDGDP